MINRRQVYDSTIRPRPFLEEMQALVNYRDLIGQLIARSVKVRYKRSFLGVAWTMVNPLLTMAVLTLVFANIFQFSGKDYALHVLSGLLIWNFFSQSTTAAMNDLVWSGGLLGRIFVPKAVFAVSALGTGLINLVLALGAYAIIALALGARLPTTILLLPLPIFLTGLFTLGIALTVSTAAIYFPDTVPMYEILLTAWMYLTPVIYPVEVLPDDLRAVLRFNPLYPLVTSFRDMLIEGRIPDAGTLLSALLISLGMLLLGWWIFTRKAREYAYRI